MENRVEMETRPWQLLQQDQRIGVDLDLNNIVSDLFQKQRRHHHHHHQINDEPLCQRDLKFLVESELGEESL